MVCLVLGVDWSLQNVVGIIDCQEKETNFFVCLLKLIEFEVSNAWWKEIKLYEVALRGRKSVELDDNERVWCCLKMI